MGLLEQLGVDVENQPFDEVAERLGVSVGTMARWLDQHNVTLDDSPNSLEKTLESLAFAGWYDRQDQVTKDLLRKVLSAPESERDSMRHEVEAFFAARDAGSNAASASA